MIYSSGTSLSIPQGDSGSILLKKEDPAGDPLNFEAGEIIRFGVKKTMTSPYLIFKEQTVMNPMTSVEIVLLPEDTQTMETTIYKYDIEITKPNGDVDTVVRAKPFAVLPTVVT